MRKIAIDKIQAPDYQSHYIKQKQYCVFLGNDVKRYFPNKKDAKQFIAETNRFLNDRVHELNYLYGIVFTEYRAIWFFVHDTDKAFIIDRKVNECIEMINKYFNNAVDRSKTTNGNYFTFKNIYGIIDNIEIALKMIAKLYEDRKYYRDVRRLNSFARQLNFIKTEIDNFGILQR